MLRKYNAANPRPLPSASRAGSLLTLDPSAPCGLRWSVARGNFKAGHPAGNLRPDGYWQVKIDNALFLAHRVAWLLAYGEDPGDLQIDHIDGDKGNNTLENLRLATNTQNQWNVGGHEGSSSRFCGAFWAQDIGRWRARLRRNGVARYLGVFRCETSAALAYHRAAVETDGTFAKTAFTRIQPEEAKNE